MVADVKCAHYDLAQEIWSQYPIDKRALTSELGTLNNGLLAMIDAALADMSPEEVSQIIIDAEGWFKWDGSITLDLRDQSPHDTLRLVAHAIIRNVLTQWAIRQRQS